MELLRHYLERHRQAAAAPCGMELVPLEVLDKIASHFAAAEWCRGPALACKTLHNIRLPHLHVQPGKNIQKTLQALAWASGNSGSAESLVLELQLQTKMPRFSQALTRRLEAHSSPLTQVWTVSRAHEKPGQPGSLPCIR